MDQENSFQWGIFIFLAAGKLPVFGGGYDFKTGWLVTILGHIQACPTRFLAQKTFVILKKRWPKKSFSWPSQLVLKKRWPNYGARGVA